DQRDFLSAESMSGGSAGAAAVLRNGDRRRPDSRVARGPRPAGAGADLAGIYGDVRTPVGNQLRGIKTAPSRSRLGTRLHTVRERCVLFQDFFEEYFRPCVVGV